VQKVSPEFHPGKAESREQKAESLQWKERREKKISPRPGIHACKRASVPKVDSGKQSDRKESLTDSAGHGQ